MNVDQPPFGHADHAFGRHPAKPRADREASLAIVAEHHGHAATDDHLMARVFRRFGWAMLTEDALAMLAQEYERQADLSERIAAENRALAKTAGAR